MAREEVLTVKVEGKIAPSLKRGMAQTTKTAKMLSKNIDQIGKETKQIRTQPVEKLQRSMKKLGASTKTTEKSMVNMGNALKVIGTIATGVALRGIVGISNEFEKARSRVMRFGGTTEEQTELFNKLRMAAIRTGTEINVFTSLFSKFSLATKRFNLSTDQVIHLSRD